MHMDVGNGWRPYPPASRDKTIINRIMLRFRPIAPKPPADNTPSPSSASKSKDLVTQRPRSKRKYVRVKKIRKRNSIRTQSIGNNNDRTAEEEGKSETTVLTLQLLPESSCSFHTESHNKGSFEKPSLMNFDNLHNIQLGVGWTDRTDRSGRVVESWVMVDGMSDTWVDGGELGYTDTEKMKNLETDSCPGLISDALNRVQWVNPAYRKMVDPWHHDGAAAAPQPELVVSLSMTEYVGGGVLLPAAFACTVRVVYWWQTKAKMQSKTMPCDVWKMAFGGFAWRLDAKAALCLGR